MKEGCTDVGYMSCILVFALDMGLIGYQYLISHDVILARCLNSPTCCTALGFTERIKLLIVDGGGWVWDE